VEKSLGGLVKSPPFYAKSEIARLRKELTQARLREAGLSMMSKAAGEADQWLHHVERLMRASAAHRSSMVGSTARPTAVQCHDGGGVS